MDLTISELICTYRGESNDIKKLLMRKLIYYKIVFQDIISNIQYTMHRRLLKHEQWKKKRKMFLKISEFYT